MMSKELEALNKIQHDFGQLKGRELVDCYETIFNGLKRLEAIDNANPSEALKAFEEFKDISLENFVLIKTDEQRLNIIKQALLKAQEQEDKVKAFDLIDTKNVDIKLLKWAYPSVEAYNTKVRVEKDYWWREELTPEEFEFLGRLAGAK